MPALDVSALKVVIETDIGIFKLVHGWHTHKITLTRHSHITEACRMVVLEDGH